MEDGIRKEQSLRPRFKSVRPHQNKEQSSWLLFYFAKKGMVIMGGRGASSSISTQSLESRVSSLAAKVQEYSKYALPSYRGADKEQKSSEYYRIKNQYNEAKNKLSELYNKQKPAELSESEKRIREQREFTKQREREITSLSYERAKKRRERDTDNWFGLNRR